MDGRFSIRAWTLWLFTLVASWWETLSRSRGPLRQIHMVLICLWISGVRFCGFASRYSCIEKMFSFRFSLIRKLLWSYNNIIIQYVIFNKVISYIGHVYYWKKKIYISLVFRKWNKSCKKNKNVRASFVVFHSSYIQDIVLQNFWNVVYYTYYFLFWLQYIFWFHFLLWRSI